MNNKNNNSWYLYLWRKIAIKLIAIGLLLFVIVIVLREMPIIEKGVLDGFSATGISFIAAGSAEPIYNSISATYSSIYIITKKIETKLKEIRKKHTPTKEEKELKKLKKQNKKALKALPKEEHNDYLKFIQEDKQEVKLEEKEGE